jgi:hypothetical protein
MARLQQSTNEDTHTYGVGIMWSNLRYTIRQEIVGQPIGRRNYWRNFMSRTNPQDPEDGATNLKVLLNDIHGRVEPGQMMAILGPSGMLHLPLSVCWH